MIGSAGLRLRTGLSLRHSPEAHGRCARRSQLKYQSLSILPPVPATLFTETTAAAVAAAVGAAASVVTATPRQRRRTERRGSAAWQEAAAEMREEQENGLPSQGRTIRHKARDDADDAMEGRRDVEDGGPGGATKRGEGGQRRRGEMKIGDG